MSRQDNPHLTYYEAKMRYLHEASKVFSAQHPDAARRLCLTGLGARGDRRDALVAEYSFAGSRSG